MQNSLLSSSAVPHRLQACVRKAIMKHAIAGSVAPYGYVSPEGRMDGMARSTAGYRRIPLEAMVIHSRYCLRKCELCVGSIGNMRG
jgi:hypothetical protein